MARVLVVSRNAAMAMGLSATEHEVVDLRPPAFQRWMDTGDRDFEALVLDLDEPDVALDAVTELRARALLAPALLVSSDRPGWDSAALRHLPAAQVLPLPISRPALLAALEDLLQGSDVEVAAPAPPVYEPAAYAEPEPDPAAYAEPAPEPEPEDDSAPAEAEGEAETEADDAAEDEAGAADTDLLAADPPAADVSDRAEASEAGQVPEPVAAPPGSGPVPHVSAQPWSESAEDDSLLGDEPEEEPRRGLPVTAAALNELHVDEGDLDEIDAVPVVAPHDYQRELGLSSRPELPVALAPAQAAARAADVALAPAAAEPAAQKPRSTAPARPVVTAPAAAATAAAAVTAPAPAAPPAARRSPAPPAPAAPPSERPAARTGGRSLLRRGDRGGGAATGGGELAAAMRPTTGPPPPAHLAPPVPPVPAAPAEPAEPVALVRRLLESAGDLYGVPETADVIVADAVERTRAEAGALLIPDEGAWRVSGGVNLRALEQRYELRPDSWLVLEVARGHKGAIIEDSDIARQPLQGAPLASWKHLLAMPIPHVEGLLLLARSDLTFSESDLAALAGLVEEAGPLLASAVDVRRLARVLGSFRDES